MIELSIEEYKKDSTYKQNIEGRLDCYIIHIGLDSINYCLSRNRLNEAREAVEIIKSII